MDDVVIKKSGQANLRIRKIFSYIAGVLEIFLACRLVLKLLGANSGSTFVSLIYTISGVFVAPFSGIFRTAVNSGIDTKSVLVRRIGSSGHIEWVYS